MIYLKKFSLSGRRRGTMSLVSGFKATGYSFCVGFLCFSNQNIQIICSMNYMQYHNFKVNKLLYIKINVWKILLDIFIKILFSTFAYFHPSIFVHFNLLQHTNVAPTHLSQQQIYHVNIVEF